MFLSFASELWHIKSLTFRVEKRIETSSCSPCCRSLHRETKMDILIVKEGECWLAQAGDDDVVMIMEWPKLPEKFVLITVSNKIKSAFKKSRRCLLLLFHNELNPNGKVIQSMYQGKLKAHCVRFSCGERVYCKQINTFLFTVCSVTPMLRPCCHFSFSESNDTLQSAWQAERPALQTAGGFGIALHHICLTSASSIREKRPLWS